MVTQVSTGEARDKVGGGAPRRTSRRGFTLIELLIVTMVIAIIASIALPNYVNSKKAANETSAINSMRVLVEAEENYRVAKGGAVPYTDLSGLKAAGQLNTALASGAMSGYTFIFQGATASTFAFKAIPQNYGGDRYFYVDHTGVLRASTEPSIDETSPPLK